MKGKNILSLSLTLMFVTLMMMDIRTVQAAPYEHELYVNGFTFEKEQWLEVGAAPWLDDWGDGNYIEGTYDTAQHRWFTFEDLILPAGEVITKVVLEGYTDGPYIEDVDYDVYTQDYQWLGSLYATETPAWVTPRWIHKDASEIAPDLLTQSGLNGLEVMLYFYDPNGSGGAGNIIDSLRLRVYTAISATIDFTPGVVNIGQGGPPLIACSITIPGYLASEIVQGTIMLNGTIAPTAFDTPSDSTLKVWFSEPAVDSYIVNSLLPSAPPPPPPPITVTLTITFDLDSGTTIIPFAGCDTVLGV